MLTAAWTPLRPHKLQSELWRTRANFVSVAAGRGSGKTELARRRVVRMLPVRKPWPDPMYFYAVPTRAQAKRVAWNAIKRLVPTEWLAHAPHESDMVIDTVYGSSLHVVGMDKPQRIEGNQWDGGVVDESCDQKPGHFGLSIVPALSHRNGWCWRIGVPKRAGPGASDFKQFFDNDSEAYTWPSSDILSEDQLRWAREHLDAKDFREQYEASWETASGLVFYAFDERANVSSDVQYNPSAPMMIGMDFNVDPMAWIIGWENGRYLDVHDEVWLRNAHTGLALDALFLRYATKHNSSWDFYGDATSRARKTAAAESDYVQIKNDKRFSPRRVYFPKANPPRRTRFSETNAMLCNALNERRLRIHPRCRNLIADLKARAYEEGTNDTADEGDVGHISDALGYVIHRRYPIKLDNSGKPTAVHVG